MQTSPISFCCTQKRDVYVTPSLIVFQRPAGFPRSWGHAVIGWHTVRIELTLIGCYRIWSDNVCGDLCNRGFPAKTNQNMCHCVQTVRNLVRGRGKFNVYEEIISLQFTVHDTSHHSVWESYKNGVDFAAGRHFGESQPKKPKSLFSSNKQRSKKL